MTRANPRGPRYDLNPEIERTQKQLKRRIRSLMERNNNNNGQPPADGQGLPAQADGAIAPTIQQMNQQLPARTVHDYLAEDLEGLNPAVTMPDFEAKHFELKPVMFNMLNTLGQFGGTPNENARHHLKSFLEICNSFKIHGVSNDVLKLKLFPYSLRDKAKTWLNNLQPGSLQSWTQLCRSFLAKFSYTIMTVHLRNQITSLMQEDDEAMHEAWERYRDLFRRCPMHGLPEWTQVSIFYNSVNTPTRMMLDVSANGTLLNKPPRESLEILDKLAQNNYQHPTSRRGSTSRGLVQLDSSDTILAQIASLTNMVKNLQKQPHIQEVKALDAFCDQCGSNHDASECGQQPTQTGFQNQPRQNPQPLPKQEFQQPTDYKNLENTLTQFMAQTSAYMARTDRFIQKTDAFMDRTEMKLQNHDATLKSLETQVGQISQILSSRPIGGFPSDTEVAKGATHEQCKAITTRSGKILKSNQGGMATNPSPATDTPAEADEPTQASDDHNNPHTTMGKSSAEPSHAQSGKPEEIRPPPPFPQRLKKQKQDYQFKKFLDILKQVHINLPLVEALQQMSNYAKFLKDMVTRKKRIEEFETAAATETCLALMHNKVPAKKTDPGSFTIECFIGHNYPTKALCDHGASINLMPKSVFQRLGIGEAKPTTVMLQLADHSYVQPEGKIEDVLVQVDKFIFPADFLILDCETNTDAPIILGRSFLATGIIYPISDSEWVSPVQCVPKKGGITVISDEKNELIPTRIVTGWRVCMDYRKLNKATRKDHFPLPFIDQMLDRVQPDCHCTRRPIKNDIHLPIRNLCFPPNAIWAVQRACHVQRCMIAIFSNLNEDCLEIFMDDFSTFGEIFDNCLSNLEKVLIRCKETNLVLNWEKCHFMVDEGIVLGHKISSKGMEVDKTKIEVISKLPPPTTVKGIRNFLGHAGFYRRFIEDFSKITKPLCSLLEQGRQFEFNEDCTKAFNLLKQKLVSAPIVEPPDWTLPFELMCDASDYAVGAVLGQRKGKIFHPIYYASKTLNDAQVNNTTTEKEMLAVIFTFDKFRSYLIGAKLCLLLLPALLQLQPHQQTEQDPPPIRPSRTTTHTTSLAPSCPDLQPYHHPSSKRAQPSQHPRHAFGDHTQLTFTTSPCQSEEAAPPLHILQLRSQLQRIEARQIHFQEEMKVFNANLLKFLQFQFPSAAWFFAQPSTTPPQPNISAAAQPSATTSAKAGDTEESPRDHLQPLGPTTTTPAPVVPILSAAPTPATSTVAERPTPDSPTRRKGKATAGRAFGREIPSSPEDEADQRPAKRRRKYHVITADNDDDDSSAEVPISKPMQGSTWIASQKEKHLHFKKCMIQGPCETLWLPETGSRQINFCMLEVPGKYPCDNGYKEVTVLPSRDIVYDQAEQLFGLRHKPIT
ncbi:hypothetical protein GQ457_09G017520 [Hibiscus cannabinus]